jgi:hypothetical protein
MFSFGELKRIMGTLIGHGTLLEPNSASVIVKQSLMNHGLMRNVQNWLIEGSRLNYSGCRSQV